MRFAIICAWTGERELALGALEALTKVPGSYTLWQLAPESDGIRCAATRVFEKIVTSLAPKE